MGAVDTTYTFTATDTITSSKMNNIIDQTTITTDAIIGTTLDVASGKLKIRSAGITSNEMGANSVTTNAITDLNITTGKVADLAVTTGKLADLSVTTGKIADDAVTYEKVPYSNIPIQIVQAVKSDTQTISGSVTDWFDVSGLSITLTRAIASASGKVRIQAAISSTTQNGSHGVAFRIMRDGVVIDAATGNADGSRLRATCNTGYVGLYNNIQGIIDFIDASPGSSSTVVYKIQAKASSGVTGYINRSNSDPNAGDYTFRTISALTLTELSP